MSSGLRYETGRDMPPGMAEKVAVQIARQMEAAAPPAPPETLPVAGCDVANKKRLIDANTLKYTRLRIFHGLNEDGTPCVGGENAVVMSCTIKEAPTVDAVEVVRCKDCKHYVEEHCCRPMDGGSYEPFPMKADDFCSYGEGR